MQLFCHAFSKTTVSRKLHIVLYTKKDNSLKTNRGANMSSNKEVFGGVEFEHWANRESLSLAEKFIIKNYLSQRAKTLEAGTAGGRIVFEMQKLGFKDLYAFDYVPEFIEEAKKRDQSGNISFAVEDATALSYNDCEFDQLIYLQQIICCIEDERGRLNAFTDAYRILKPGGIAIFSFLCFDWRIKSNFYGIFLAYLQLQRKVFNSNTPIQYLPQLKIAGKMNFGAIFDQQPYKYWYYIDEVYQIFKDVGFEIVALGTDLQLNQAKMLTSVEAIKKEPIQGMLYFVCKK